MHGGHFSSGETCKYGSPRSLKQIKAQMQQQLASNVSSTAAAFRTWLNRRHSLVQKFSSSIAKFTARSTERFWLRPAKCQKALTLGNTSGHMGHGIPVRRGGVWSKVL